MNKLFIIGNGFDLAHGIKSSYSDFKDYLEENYEISYGFGEVPEIGMNPDGSDRIDDNECVTFIINKLDDIEYQLKYKKEIENKIREYESEQLITTGNINSVEILKKVNNEYGKWSYIEESCEFFTVDDDDVVSVEDWKDAYYNEDVAICYYEALKLLPDYFSEWVEKIDIYDAVKNKKFEKLISNNDTYLSFNYTSTLEEIYGIEQVTHIHGYVENGDTLVFGHGDTDPQFVENQSSIGIHDSLSRLNNELKKDVISIIDNNSEFFDSLEVKEINEIYVYGFSFGEVDLAYIKLIINRTSDREITWYLNDYNKAEVKEFTKKLRNLGFSGSIETYSC